MRFLKATFFGFACLIVTSMAPNTARAADPCSACFAAGFQASCFLCASATTSAMTAIGSAITASETTILAATGIFPPNPTIGFPALQDTINGAEAQQTKSLVSALTASNKVIVQVLQQLPANQQKAEVSRKLAQAELIGSEAGCTAVNYGLSSGLQGKSALPYGWLWQKGAGLTGSLPSGVNAGKVGGTANESSGGDPSDSGSEGGLGSLPVVTTEAGAAALISNISDQAMNRVGKTFLQLRTTADKKEAGASAMLKPELLISEQARVLSEDPDEFGISDSQRMDLLIQYLSVDEPSSAEAIMASASTPGLLKLAVPDTIISMETGMSMAVMDKIIKNRRQHPGTLGAEEYLRTIIPSRAPGDAVSEDEFTYLTTHYRTNDPDWIAKIDLSDEFAIKQYAQMEAEQLANKYKTWVLKRDTVIMMSQVLANMIESER
jgi:hypothetical protein